MPYRCQDFKLLRMRTEQEIREALAIFLIELNRLPEDRFPEQRKQTVKLARLLNWVLERDQFQGLELEELLETRREELRNEYPDAYHNVIQTISDFPLRFPLP